MGRFPVAVVLYLLAWLVWLHAPLAQAQTLTKRLLAEEPSSLADDARKAGDARRGAILFYQPYLACTRCHTNGKDGHRLGPDLSRRDQPLSDPLLIQSVLDPSGVIKKGYETITVVTGQGKTIVGLLVDDGQRQLVLRDPTGSGQTVAIDKSTIEERNNTGPSIMPQGVVDQLASRQQFLDLLKYLMEVRQGGPSRALALRPDPALYAPRPLPEYEKTIDHAGMIGELNRQSFQRGAAIYNRLCINCHGTHDRPGTLPTSLRFATGKFKNGGDPYTMYQTLTKGFGMMVPQLWMVPQQKYDVIHYIREAYLKQHNPEQYVRVDVGYLAGLPQGSGRGPQPSEIQPWDNMNYGPNLVATYEVGNDAASFA
ncbi:MAG: c-type cytochrome, partial [Planctomycetaceae bacterium]